MAIRVWPRLERREAGERKLVSLVPDRGRAHDLLLPVARGRGEILHVDVKAPVRDAPATTSCTPVETSGAPGRAGGNQEFLEQAKRPAEKLHVTLIAEVPHHRGKAPPDILDPRFGGNPNGIRRRVAETGRRLRQASKVTVALWAPVVEQANPVARVRDHSPAAGRRQGVRAGRTPVYPPWHGKVETCFRAERHRAQLAAGKVKSRDSRDEVTVGRHPAPPCTGRVGAGEKALVLPDLVGKGKGPPTS